MKIFSRKALAILLCIATLVSFTAVFTSCKKETAEAAKKIIVENGASEYVVIRAEKADEATMDLVVSLRVAIEENCGCNIKIASDWVRSESDIDPSAKEILVGNTNRPETKEVLDTLEENSWAVVDKGNKIVICANNSALLTTAVQWFMDNCINEADKTVAITEKLVKTEGFGDGMPICIGGVSDYQVVYPKGNETLEYYASLFGLRASVTKVVDDSKAATEKEIVIGNTKRKDVTLSGTNQYSITTENSKVYINATDDRTLYYAVNYYIEHGMTIKDTVVSAPADYEKSGALTNYFANKWVLDLPCIDEGKATLGYNIGTGLASDLDAETPIDSYMHLVSEVEYSAFENYAKKLESFGFKKIYTSKTENNDLWCYRLGAAYAYIHYTPSQKYIRVVWDKSSNCEVSDVDSPAEQTGTTTFYQYSLDYEGAKLNYSDYGINCGMLYIVKLQDNSLILVDGGIEGQASEKSLKGLTDFLYEITGTPQKEALKVRFWYFTHPDGDHAGLSYRFLDFVKSNGHKAVDVQALGFNFPSERANETVTKTTSSYNMIDYMNKNYPNVKYLKLHTGMTFNIAEVNIEVLGTIENIVNLKGSIPSNYDTNDTCSLLRFNFGGKSVLMTGDIGNDVSVEFAHTALYSAGYLKSDILQASHHGYNLITTINNSCDPEYVLISNAYEYLLTRSDKYNHYTKLTTPNKVFFAGNFTTALAVTGGKIEVTKIPRYDNPTGELASNIK